jgi:DNA polymerase-3 subunit delta'
MLRADKVPHTILLDGAEGTGKATLVRRFAANVLGGAAQIERDDLSLPHNLELLADREKWTAEKRNDDPLRFGTHPDFVTFAPDGPLRQISISQVRALREEAQLAPLKGSRRVFLIDRVDRANEQAANSLLKVLEEPPDHLTLFLTASNTYDLLPTIRSRAVPVRLAPLTEDEMRAFLDSRPALDRPGRRLALANGSPGLAATLDIDAYDRRRAAMLALLRVAAGLAPFGAWIKFSESIASSKSERLDDHLDVLGRLLEDIVHLQCGLAVRSNPELTRELETISKAVGFSWIRRGVDRSAELARLARRNIQKGIAFDAFVMELQDARRV